MKICFTIDDVMRNKTKAFIKAYNKEQHTDIDPDTFVPTSADLKDMFKFKTVKDFYKFLYDDYAFEIFGEAEQCSPMLDKKMNLWLIDIIDTFDEEGKDIDFMWANTDEFNQSIGNTYFYLSRIASRVREVFFPKKPIEIWDKCDILVTANPELIANKPSDKMVIKIETPYNREVKSDITYTNLAELFNDKEFIKKINIGK